MRTIQEKQQRAYEIGKISYGTQIKAPAQSKEIMEMFADEERRNGNSLLLFDSFNKGYSDEHHRITNEELRLNGFFK